MPSTWEYKILGSGDDVLTARIDYCGSDPDLAIDEIAEKDWNESSPDYWKEAKFLIRRPGESGWTAYDVTVEAVPTFRCYFDELREDSE